MRKLAAVPREMWTVSLLPLRMPFYLGGGGGFGRVEGSRELVGGAEGSRAGSRLKYHMVSYVEYVEY